MGYGDEKLLQELDIIAQDLDVKDRYSKFGPVHSELVPQYTSSADIGVAPILNSCLSYYLVLRIRCLNTCMPEYQSFAVTSRN